MNPVRHQCSVRRVTNVGWPTSWEVGNTNSVPEFAFPTAKAMGHPVTRQRVTVGALLRKRKQLDDVAVRIVDVHLNRPVRAAPRFGRHGESEGLDPSGRRDRVVHFERVMMTSRQIRSAL